MSITAKGRRWEILHSLWIGWTFTLGFFNWIAFVYIGFRAKQWKWILWGVLYLVPLAVVILLLEADASAALGVPALLLTFGVGVASIFHAFMIRKEYLLRLEAMSSMASGKEAALKRRVETETASGKIVEEQETHTLKDGGQAPEHRRPQRQAGPSKDVSVFSPAIKPKSQATGTNGTSERMPAPPPKVSHISPVTQSGDELEYRISSSYPFPLAFGFRSLMSIVDYRDLYREQLRIAENILAFLASVSLTLLREEDQQEADIDLKGYWRSGISPGDWKDIVGRCSKVFAAYKDNPLALEISRLNIRSEKKGFGQDIAKLIQTKNDYKHDRGPTVQEDIIEASEVVQETLKRCMEKLSFFTDYPIRQVEDFNVSRNGGEFLLKCLHYMGDHPSFPQEEVIFHRGLPRGDLFLDLDGRNWVPLYPFIVTMTCSHCKAKETYFIDLWDPRREVARMKSFERGHTMNNTNVSEALARWG